MNTPQPPVDENPEDAGQQDEGSKEGVVIPEDFQQAVHGIVKQATTKHHLSHIRDRVNAKEDEIRKAEMEAQQKAAPKKGGKKSSAPEEYSTAGMP